MPTFAFTARDPRGRTQRGVQVAGSALELAGQLRQRNWLVLDVAVTADEGRSALAEMLDPRGWLRVRSVDVEMVLRQMAVMLRSGLTLLASLTTSAEQVERLRLQRILRQIIGRIQEGSSFSEALAEHPCFNQLTVQLVRVGEQTGNLDTVMEGAAEAMERRRLLLSQVVTALTYPFIVLVSAIGVTTFMVFGVIPKLEIFVKVMGRKLPPMTQALMDISLWLRTNGIVTLSVLVALAVGFFAIYSTRQGRLTFDRSLLQLPLLGRVFRVAGTALFSRALCIMVRSGVTLLDSLRTMEQLGTNKHLSQVVSNARQRVFAGGGLAEALAVRLGFMPMLPKMVAVGETAGTLDDVLDEVAKFHEQLLAVLIKQLSALVEPAIIIFVGGLVGFVYISFFLALYAAAGPAK